jgi:hypothetical protein
MKGWELIALERFDPIREIDCSKFLTLNKDGIFTFFVFENNKIRIKRLFLNNDEIKKTIMEYNNTFKTEISLVSNNVCQSLKINFPEVFL